VGQVVLVTGASSGIGLATASAFAAAGDRVFGSVRGPEGAAALADAGLGREAVLFDVTDESAVRRGVAEVLDLAGRIDVLVNNAGIAPSGAVETTADEEWREVFEVNVLGAVRVTRAVLPAMRAAGTGAIVNVSSFNGRFAGPFIGAYSASKFALEGLSEALRLEVEDFGIRVVVVEPGQFDTPIFAKMRDHPDPDPTSPYAANELASRQSSPQPGAAADPSIAARVIVAAAKGERKGFRLPAGDDATLYLDVRAKTSDDDWFELVKRSSRRKP
jgi:NAD(P)-dependent dehydrogenase (short-subunit alcohol dehydrogenase family)